MLVWSVVCIVTFVFARSTRSDNYRTFFKHLLGRLWPFAELLFLLSSVITLAVFGAAAGALGEATFGWPALVGTLALMGGIVGFSAYGNESVESLFKYVSLLLYGTYAVFVALALTTFGQRILPNFATAVFAEAWAFKGLQYAGYNVSGAVAILPVLRHMRSSRDAVIAGVLAGPLAMVPAFLFFICMVAYYPHINGEVLPSDFLLGQLNFPLFHVLFQLMIFSALLECGTGMVHAVNERVASVYDDSGRVLDKRARLAISAALLVGSVFLATRFGLVDLIDRFYGALGVAFLLVYVLPLMTFGIYRLWSNRWTLL
jgi:uncharacterized membrane protein YkvI